MGVAGKLYLDAVEQKKAVLDAREKLLRFYDLVPIHSDFKKVTRVVFKELVNRIRNDKRNGKKRDVKLS